MAAKPAAMPPNLLRLNARDFHHPRWGHYIVLTNMDKEVDGTTPETVAATTGDAISYHDTPAKGPENVADRPHHWTVLLSIAAVLVSMTSAGTSVYQYRLALRVREDAREAAKKQMADIERTRKAAEDSAAAAIKSLDITERNARAAEDSASAARLAVGVAQQQYALNFVPAVDVTYSSDGAVHLANKGKDNILFWGASYRTSGIQAYSALIAPGSSTEIFFPEIVRMASRPAGGNQPQRGGIPCDLYIRTANQQNYDVSVSLWIMTKGGRIEQVNPVIQTIKTIGSSSQTLKPPDTGVKK